jgi:membrane associated rhomboid family serine protease
MISIKLIGSGYISRSIRSTLKLKPKTPSLLYFNRNYIRPHYYNEQPLSKALQQQRNPFNQIGRRINRLDPNKVMWAVIGTNVGIYFMWQYAINSYKTFGDTHWLNIMAKNFINSTESMKEGRYHTLLTSAFSHKSLDHLGLNMLVLYSIGQGVLEAVGASRFLLLYAGAGVASSVVALTYRQYIRPILEKNKYGKKDDSKSGSMGASGR